ncbi:MAG: hypothetical protein ACOC3V_04030 [bacterium]
MRIKRFEQINESKLDDYSFITKLDSDILIYDESIEGYNNIDWLETKLCTIYWDYELNTANWGINYILPRIIRVVLDVVVYKDEEGEDTEEKEYVYDILNSDIKTESEDNVQKLPFSPQEIEFSHLDTSEQNKSKIKIIF